MLKILIFLIIINPLIIYSTPIISIDTSKLSKISKYSPYLYQKHKNKVYLLGEKKIISQLKKYNINYEIVYPSENKYNAEKKAIISNENFIKYGEVTDKIDELVFKYPNIVEKFVIGKTIEGRDIVGLKTISSKQNPKYRIIGGIHGDEAMSYQFVFDFMVYLVENNNKYTNIFENAQIYFIPMVNPDGAVNVTRRNSNNVDLNRNMGFFWREITFSGNNFFTEPETKSLRDFTIDKNFTMSFSFHTYGDIINYVWNFTPDKPADINEILNISNIYESFTSYEVTGGYDWYQTTGDVNDFSYGVAGTLDWTIEMNDSDENGELFTNNKDALIKVLKTSNYGMEGMIYDENNTPLNASVIIDDSSLFYTNDGYFYRYLLDGLHSIKVIVNGYDVFEDSIEINGDKPYLNIYLNKNQNSSSLFVNKITSVKATFNNHDDYVNVLLPKNLLFMPDNKYFRLPQNGEVVVELPQKDKKMNLDLILYNYDNIDLTIEGYTAMDENKILSTKYTNFNDKIEIDTNIKYLKIIENNSDNFALIDSILLKDIDENDEDKDVYHGSGFCNFSSNSNNLILYILLMLIIYVLKRRYKFEQK